MKTLVPANMSKKNLANLSESQLKMLKQSLGKISHGEGGAEVEESRSKKNGEEGILARDLKSEPDRMEMSDGEGKMSEGEN